VHITHTLPHQSVSTHRASEDPRVKGPRVPSPAGQGEVSRNMGYSWTPKAEEALWRKHCRVNSAYRVQRRRDRDLGVEGVGRSSCEWTRRCQRQTETWVKWEARAKSLNMTCWNKDGEGGLQNGHAAELRSKADAPGR